MSAAERPLSEILEDMAHHTTSNPTHGFNGACKDKYVGEIKRILTPESWREFALVASYVQSSPVLRPLTAAEMEDDGS